MVEPQVPSDKPYASTSGKPKRASKLFSNSADAGAAPQIPNLKLLVSGRSVAGNALSIA